MTEKEQQFNCKARRKMLLQQYSMKLRTKKGEKEKNIQIQKLDF